VEPLAPALGCIDCSARWTRVRYPPAASVRVGDPDRIGHLHIATGGSKEAPSRSDLSVHMVLVPEPGDSHTTPVAVVLEPDYNY
jgi:hypothetical protein